MITIRHPELVEGSDTCGINSNGETQEMIPFWIQYDFIPFQACLIPRQARDDGRSFIFVNVTSSKVGHTEETKRNPVTRWRIIGLVLAITILLIVDQILALTTLPATRMTGDYHFDWLIKARDIGIALFQYSENHGGKYPDGKSSTEIFQKLLDQGYIDDPETFYIWLPGKLKGTRGVPLKSENVCYDVTGGVEANDSDDLPIVYMTGFKVTFVPGSSATPLVKPYPTFMPPRTWGGWLSGQPRFFEYTDPGIAVMYKSNASHIVGMIMSGNSIGTLPNFVPPTFDGKGKTYHQLTPDGPLP